MKAKKVSITDIVNIPKFSELMYDKMKNESQKQKTSPKK